jgi:hypothetical protein
MRSMIYLVPVQEERFTKKMCFIRRSILHLQTNMQGPSRALTPGIGVLTISQHPRLLHQNRWHKLRRNSPNLLSYTGSQGDSQAVLEVSYLSSSTCDHTGLYKIDKNVRIRYLTSVTDGCYTNTVTAKYRRQHHRRLRSLQLHHAGH